MDEGDSSNENKPLLYYGSGWIGHSLYLLE